MLCRIFFFLLGTTALFPSNCDAQIRIPLHMINTNNNITIREWVESGMEKIAYVNTLCITSVDCRVKRKRRAGCRLSNIGFHPNSLTEFNMSFHNMSIDALVNFISTELDANCYLCLDSAKNVILALYRFY